VKAKKENYRTLLRSAGLRHTAPREALLSHLNRRDALPSPEELHKKLFRKANIGLSTVYLNIRVLGKRGLIREFKDPDGRTRLDGWREPHAHLIDLKTSEIVDVPLKDLGLDREALLRELSAKVGRELRDIRIELIAGDPLPEEKGPDASEEEQEEEEQEE